MKCAMRAGGRGPRLIALTALALAILFQSNAAAKTGERDFSAEFSLPESDGYAISVTGRPKSLKISLAGGQPTRRHLVFSVYTFSGTASAKGIHADLGGFGAINMRFEPSGKVRTTRLPKAAEGCDGPRKVVRHLGTFVGTFRFEAEDETTTESAEVAGSVGRPAEVICRFSTGESGKENHHHRNVPPPSPYLGATTTHNGLGFAAAVMSPHRRRVSFVASSVEVTGGAAIRRWAAVAGSRSEFQFDDRLTTATVSPPPPFSGSATFERAPKSLPPIWSGSLAVSFPGRPEVPLTGTNFTSVLFARF